QEPGFREDDGQDADGPEGVDEVLRVHGGEHPTGGGCLTAAPRAAPPRSLMAKPLVIVESPAKARTISRFLGDDYVVESSIGHVRDLPRNAAEVPESHKGESW